MNWLSEIETWKFWANKTSTHRAKRGRMDECEAKEKKTFNDDSLCGTLRRYERSINDLKRSVNNTQRESFISYSMKLYAPLWQSREPVNNKSDLWARRTIPFTDFHMRPLEEIVWLISSNSLDAPLKFEFNYKTNLVVGDAMRWLVFRLKPFKKVMLHIKRDTKAQPQNDEIDKRKLRKVFEMRNFCCKIPDAFSSWKIALDVKKLLWMGKQVGKHFGVSLRHYQQDARARSNSRGNYCYSILYSVRDVVSFCRKVSHNLWYSLLTLLLQPYTSQCKLEWKRIRIRSGGRDNGRRSKIP